MSSAIFVPIVALFVTLAVVPLSRWFCEHMQILDKPGPLKIHARPIPRLGGVAIFLAVFAGLFAANRHPGAPEGYFVAAASLLWIVGLLDDLRGLHPVPRLLAQVTAAAVLWSGGWHLRLFANSLADLAALCVFVVLFVNSWNFLDGADGLAAGFTCVIALSYAVLPQATLSAEGFIIAYALATTCAIFLLWNAHPAKIFLGDSGSTVLGFVVAFLALDYTKTSTGTPHSQLFPFAIAALPLLDAIRIVIQRLSQRRSVFEGTRNHFYDLLLARGDSPHKVALMSWGIGLICGAVGISIVYFRASPTWCFVAIILVAIWIASMAAASKVRPRRLTP